MKYEIEIEGLPEGWEPVAVAIPGEDEKIWTSKGIVSAVSAIHCEPALIVRRKVRKYDWSKTLDDVLVYDDDGHIYPHDCTRPRGFYTGWQPNIHGKCPVDPDASIVNVRFMDGDEDEGKASTFAWGHSFHPGTIVSWQFIRLADGVEW